ncbi:MAG: phosphoglycerate kinase [Elusimicrobia bacterium]|nr:phosphoglycerate kinase [Elusimicrobiota bacterium]MDE2236590.1 phosphoglycerate kinase [Elusimicrobiota bacterium]MDE2426050.1 phosphoglycerate kinase [Elusimicrobiota bacterium]
MTQNPPSKPALKLRRLQEVALKGKRALVRVDYNVPIRDGVVEDDARVRETLPTLRHLIDNGAKIVLICHLGRPKGKPDPKYSVKPVAASLEKLLGRPVAFAQDCAGAAAEKAAAALKPGEVLLCENLRFHAGEEANDPAFAKALSRLGDVFVQDAFGALHRAHASTAGLPKLLPGSIGLLVQKELEFLDRVIGNPARPFLSIVGGAKVSDKLGVLNRLLDRVDALLIGGGMAYTFLAAQGISIGRSLLEKEKVRQAQGIVEKAYAKKVECLLPADHVCVREIKPEAETVVTPAMAIPEDLIGVDIGPHTIEFFVEQIEKAKTIFWNGPMGIFEMPAFSAGSFAVAKALAKATKAGSTTIVGGGDSLAVLAKTGLAGEMSHCSTGGGASLELLEGKPLPGLTALAA